MAQGMGLSDFKKHAAKIEYVEAVYMGEDDADVHGGRLGYVLHDPRFFRVAPEDPSEDEEETHGSCGSPTQLPPAVPAVPESWAEQPTLPPVTPTDWAERETLPPTSSDWAEQDTLLLGQKSPSPTVQHASAGSPRPSAQGATQALWAPHVVLPTITQSESPNKRTKRYESPRSEASVGSWLWSPARTLPPTPAAMVASPMDLRTPLSSNRALEQSQSILEN